jgi:hypothetical protein
MVLETGSGNGTRPCLELSRLAPTLLKSLPQQPSVSVLITCFNYGAYVGHAFLAHPAAGFAIHRVSLVDQQKRARGVYPLLSALPSGDCAQITYDNAGILMGLPPTTNLALRREVADRIFPIPVEYTGYAEQRIHRMAPLMTELCAVDVPLAEWRLHGQNDQNSSRITPRRL